MSACAACCPQPATTLVGPSVPLHGLAAWHKGCWWWLALRLSFAGNSDAPESVLWAAEVTCKSPTYKWSKLCAGLAHTIRLPSLKDALLTAVASKDTCAAEARHWFQPACPDPGRSEPKKLTRLRQALSRALESSDLRWCMIRVQHKGCSLF